MSQKGVAKASKATGDGLEDQKEPHQSGIVILNTLNGELHGVDPKTGSRLWTTRDGLGPMVQVQSTEKTTDFERIQPLQGRSSNDHQGQKDSPRKKGVFIPELAGGVGHLYYYEAGGSVKVPLCLQ
jgi:topoisomerase IA-like protein